MFVRAHMNGTVILKLPLQSLKEGPEYIFLLQNSVWNAVERVKN